MRTFQASGEQGEKFWSILLQGRSLTLREGTVGKEETVRTERFASEEKAQEQHDRLIRTLLSWGYVEKTPGRHADPLGSALEATLAENPDDRAAHAAYADWLSEQPDPILASLGEFVATQLALEDKATTPAERQRLRGREKELLQQYQAIWVRELAPYLSDGLERVTVQFARGWVDHLTVQQISDPLARVIAGLPELRLLRRLCLLWHYHAPGREDSNPMRVLASAGNLKNVRTLQVRGIPADNLGELVVGLTRLEELSLEVDTEWYYVPGLWDVFHFRLSHLRSLSYSGVHEFPLQQLADNTTLTSLRSLKIIQLGNVHEPVSPLGLEALVEAPHLRGLRHLQVALHLTDEAYQTLLNSSLMNHLASVELGPLGGGEEIAYLVNRSPRMRAFRRVASGRWERA